jgi:hypothetical protein
MAKSGGSLGRGRRRLDEVPSVPHVADLSEVQRRAQQELHVLVEQAGGRLGSGPRIVARDLEPFIDLFNEWAQRYGEVTESGACFSGRPGLWHALDELYPLQDPNRWDGLRLAVIAELEDGNWTRRTPPRGSVFDISR